MYYKRFVNGALFAILLATCVRTVGCSSNPVVPEKPDHGSTEDGLPGWTTLSPLPQANTLRAVHMVDENILFAVGEAGTIIRSLDGGVTWEIQRVGSRIRILNEIAINGSFGLAVGDNGQVVRTRDGGDSWQTLDLGWPSSTDLRGVTVLDQSIAVIVGDEGLIRRTEDGGTSWIVQDSGNESLYDASFVSPNRGMAVGLAGAILWTEDGGRNWLQTTLPGGPSNLLEAELLDVNEAIVAGEGSVIGTGVIWTTDDGGATWINRWTYQRGVVQELSMVSPLIGFVLTPSRPVRTTDGGLSWTILEPPMFKGSWDLSAGSATELTCVGISGSILRSHDAGENWTEMSQPMHPDFGPYLCRTVQMIDTKLGYVGSGTGGLLTTTDGGHTWEVILDAASVLEIYFFDDMAGVVSASFGGLYTLQHTSDGGANWEEVYTGYDIDSIHFADRDHGLATSFHKIFRSTNGGTSWDAPIVAPDSHSYFDVFCLSPDTVVVLGSDSTIFRSTNGGTLSWDPTTVSVQPLGVDFNEDRSIGVIVGSSSEGGVILRTTDAGATWKTVDTVDTGLNEVSFADEKTIFAVGERGFVVKSIDGGLIWEWQNSPTVNSLMTVDFGGTNHGFIGGFGGTLMMTETGGLELEPGVGAGR